MSTSTITPYRLAIPDAALDDLHERLARTRWPDEQHDVGRSQGLPLDVTRDLVAAWRGFDWRAREAQLNTLAQYRSEIDGTGLHFVHERADDPDAPALLLLHGWPSTMADYSGLVAPLREHFHVVVPSLPGFPLSGPTPGAGWGTRRMADAFAVLMSDLGYDRFGVHGADTGAIIGRLLAVHHPDRVTMLHSVDIATATAGPDDALTDEDTRRLGGSQEYMTQHSGYAMEQAQRPLTLGYGLTDSPVGQLAWIGEKLHDWADDATPIPVEAILTTVSLYWLTASATSAARVYWEGARDGSWFQAPEVSTVPTAVAVFPNGLAGTLPVRHLAERVNPIVRWTEFDQGGHFPALEVPDLLLEDIRATFGAG